MDPTKGKCWVPVSNAHLASEGAWSRNSLNQTVFHVQVSMEGLVVIHDLPTFDQKAVTLVETKWDTFSPD